MQDLLRSWQYGEKDWSFRVSDSADCSSSAVLRQRRGACLTARCTVCDWSTLRISFLSTFVIAQPMHPTTRTVIGVIYCHKAFTRHFNGCWATGPC